MDVHVPAAIVHALRRRGLDVLTAQQDARDETSDPELLDRATELGRIIFTCDTDFLAEGRQQLHENRVFATIVFAHQQHLSIRTCVEDLELVATPSSKEEHLRKIIFLPL
jgi:hypothetical protein